MTILLILNDPPYGTERTYNGLRLALNLLQRAEGTWNFSLEEVPVAIPGGWR